MDKIRCGKCTGWIAISVLLGLLALVTAQPGFLNINCGGKGNHTAENGLTWISDTDYINVGDIADIGNATEVAYGSYVYSLRFFPKPLKKSCYHLPVTPNLPYLLRLSFVIGNYSGFETLPSFSVSIETLDILAVQNITVADTHEIYGGETILSTSGTVTYVCLIRTSELDDPFISSIQLIALKDGMYGQAKRGTALWTTINGRFAVNSTVRYPQDNFDRLWASGDSIFNSPISYLVSSGVSISINNTEDLPPTAVMQKAWISNSSAPITIPLLLPEGGKFLLLLYFAEIERLHMSESRTFYVTVNGERQSENITLMRNYCALELALQFNKTEVEINIVKASNSTRAPLLNAFESYYIVDTQPATYSQDIDALDTIKTEFDIKDWISDPCYLIQWEGIGCDSSSSAIRITEM